jgi:hypothetical protein
MLSDEYKEYQEKESASLIANHGLSQPLPNSKGDPLNPL